MSATLLDQGRYLCSPRQRCITLLAAQGEVRERRNQLMHPHYQRPELLASPYKKPEHWIVRGSLQMTNEKCQMTNGKYQFLDG